MYLFDKDRIDAAKPLLADYLEQHHNINIRKRFNCLNPDHDDIHPSMAYDRKNHRCICFSCQCKYDIFDVVGIDYHISDTIEKFKKLYTPQTKKTCTEETMDLIKRCLNEKAY